MIDFKAIAFIFIMFISLPSLAQHYLEVNPMKEEAGFTLVEKWPMYPNGEQGVLEHIKNNLIYPEEALKDSIQGQVVIKYLVETSGRVGEIEILQSAHPLLDKEAERIIQTMDKWKPAIQRGKPVKMAFEQVINFSYE